MSIAGQKSTRTRATDERPERFPARASATVLDLVGEHAELRPTAPALLLPDSAVVTYGELWRTAAGIADRLLELGTVPGQLVGVAAERGLPFVASTMAAWMVGATYLPMDVGNPAERLRDICREARLEILITSASTQGLGEDIGVGTELCIAGCGPTGDSPPARSDAAAYVIYTSGSSGVPKGVVVGHPALRNLADWHRREFSVTTADRMLHTAGLGFDAAVQEVWPYLTAGATVAVSSDSNRSVPAYLVEDLRDLACTTAFISTPLAEEVMRLAPRLDDLRLLFTGGDRLNAHHQPTSYQLINEYGPTECTVVSTFHRVRPSDAEPPPIGVPIQAVTASVRNPAGTEVAAGEPGELYLAGANLADGYLGRPDLDEAAFPVLDGRRWYRTGDLVRDRGNVLYFEGRVDREQLKVNGLRIEAGDIEAALTRVPEVGLACCVLDDAGSLVAVVTGDLSSTAPAIRRHLAGVLPRGVVPARFVQVAALPLTTNGKVDRGAVALLANDRPRPTTD